MVFWVMKCNVFLIRIYISHSANYCGLGIRLNSWLNNGLNNCFNSVQIVRTFEVTIIMRVKIDHCCQVHHLDLLAFQGFCRSPWCFQMKFHIICACWYSVNQGFLSANANICIYIGLIWCECKYKKTLFTFTLYQINVSANICICTWEAPVCINCSRMMLLLSLIL
jgi:hypothetical protein